MVEASPYDKVVSLNSSVNSNEEVAFKSSAFY